MKKLLILAVAATMSMTAMAQSTKKAEAVQKKIEKSDKAIADSKKAAKPATWIDRGSIFTDAATAYTSSLIANLPISQMSGADKLGEAKSVEEAALASGTYKKYVYDKIDVYTDANDNIVFWYVKQEAVPGALQTALESFQKAESLDAGTFAKTTGKAGAALSVLSAEMNNTARNAYMVGKHEEASADFVLAYEASKLSGKVDTTALAFAGICAFEGGDFETAKELNEQLLSIGGEQEGATYYYLGTCYEKLGDTDKALAVMEEGFSKFPANSTVMGGLINIYMVTNQDSKKLVDLIHKAQELDPKNISLFLVESQIWDQIGERDQAYKALDKVIELDPKNMQAYYNYAIFKILSSDEVAKAADKLDINDVEGYEKMLKEVEELRRSSVTYLEKAYEIAPEDQGVIDILTQMYFVCRDYSDEYVEKHKAITEKYAK